MNLFTYGAKFDNEDMQGMLQLGDLNSSGRSEMLPCPLTELNLKMWKIAQDEADVGILSIML